MRYSSGQETLSFPMVGLQAGEQVWTAALGFLVTGVGLPVLTVIALAKVGGVLKRSVRLSAKLQGYHWRLLLICR